jgi:hypothetical protein
MISGVGTDFAATFATAQDLDFSSSGLATLQESLVVYIVVFTIMALSVLSIVFAYCLDERDKRLVKELEEKEQKEMEEREHNDNSPRALDTEISEEGSERESEERSEIDEKKEEEDVEAENNVFRSLSSFGSFGSFNGNFAAGVKKALNMPDKKQGLVPALSLSGDFEDVNDCEYDYKVEHEYQYERGDEEDDDGLSWWHGNVVGAHKSTDSFLDRAMPSALSSAPLGKRIWRIEKAKHKWLSVLFHYDPAFPRAIRCLANVTDIFLCLFVDAALYNLANPDDGSCDILYDAESCLAEESSLKAGENKCIWDGTNCYYLQPEESFNRVLLSFLLLFLIGVPMSKLNEYICENWIALPTEPSDTFSDAESEVEHTETSDPNIRSPKETAHACNSDVSAIARNLFTSEAGEGERDEEDEGVDENFSWKDNYTSDGPNESMSWKDNEGLSVDVSGGGGDGGDGGSGKAEDRNNFEFAALSPQSKLSSLTRKGSGRKLAGESPFGEGGSAKADDWTTDASRCESQLLF